MGREVAHDPSTETRGDGLTSRGYGYTYATEAKTEAAKRLEGRQYFVKRKDEG
jgi:hypothetical protein